MNEFEAAMGLCMLDEMDNILQIRKEIITVYQRELEGLVEFQRRNILSTQNYSYFPIILKNENQLLKLEKALNENKIYPRRYFYPSLDSLSYIEPKQFMPVSRDIARRIMCLPISSELKKEEHQLIIKTVKGEIK